MDTSDLAKAGVWVSDFTGRVVGQQKWSETHVSGGGGGGSAYIHPRYGGTVQTSSVKIGSTVTENLEFFLKNDQQEKRFKVRNAGIGLRDGHVVTVWWAARVGEENGSYVRVLNHNTQEDAWLKSGLERATRNKGFWLTLTDFILLGWLFAGWIPMAIVVLNSRSLGLWTFLSSWLGVAIVALVVWTSIWRDVRDSRQLMLRAVVNARALQLRDSLKSPNPA